jgi:hypothetical protein
MPLGLRDGIPVGIEELVIRGWRLYLPHWGLPEVVGTLPNRFPEEL